MVIFLSWTFSELLVFLIIVVNYYDLPFWIIIDTTFQPLKRLNIAKNIKYKFFLIPFHIINVQYLLFYH